jgi:aryl-alcohol dehydrogenase-like predicted oxidoreductase/enamine deaminase RidA (YjgF/YER057c/UK114 family)
MTTPPDRHPLAPDLTLSRALTGLWQIADMERNGPLDLDEAAAAMEPYADAGLTTFDMADHYGSAEEVAGRFVTRRGSTDGIELLTKWVPKPGRLTRDDVRAAVERSLARMQLERLDLLQFHTWSYDDPSWLDALWWLQELQREGLIGRLGLTNVDTAHLRIALASGIEIVSNQVCYSLLDRRPGGAMAALCAERGGGILAYGTLAGGLLTDRWLDRPQPGPDEGSWSQQKYLRFVEAAGGWEPLQRLLRALARVAERREVSIANVASRWVLERPAVAGVIVGARLGRSEHIADTKRLFGFALDATDRAEIDAALAELTPLPGDSGDEYRKPPFLTATGDLSQHLDSFPPPFERRLNAAGRSVALSGTRWETLAGYGRALRRGDRILVSGTTATHGERLVGGSDAAAQTHAVIDKIEGALRSLGGRLDDVVRTRIVVQNEADVEAISRAHGERFGEVRPANTLIRADLIGDDYLVEIDAEALLD